MENYFKKIIDLFTQSDVSTSLQDEFHRWLTGEKFSREKENALRDLWNHTEESTLTEMSNQTRQSMDDVFKKIRERQRTVNVKRLRFWQISAAILLIALLSTLYFLPNKTPANNHLIEQYTSIAEKTHLTLPDGTEVQLNSTAILLYPSQFSGDSRGVYLIGEANFKVAENAAQPFIVRSNDYQVTALGTEFNMKSYPNDPILSTTLLSGSVEVLFNNLEEAVILKPNEQFTFNRQTKEESITHPDMEDVTAWQRGELVFKSASLEEIIAVLERKYAYSFIYSPTNVRDEKYTLRFKDTAPLEEIMEIIAEVSGDIEYQIENNKCYISLL